MQLRPLEARPSLIKQVDCRQKQEMRHRAGTARCTGPCNRHDYDGSNITIQVGPAFDEVNHQMDGVYISVEDWRRLEEGENRRLSSIEIRVGEHHNNTS